MLYVLSLKGKSYAVKLDSEISQYTALSMTHQYFIWPHQIAFGTCILDHICYAIFQWVVPRVYPNAKCGAWMITCKLP